MRLIATLPLVILAALGTACDRHPDPQADPEPKQGAGGPAAVSAALCLPRAGALPPPEKLADWARGAQLFDDLGSFHRKVTTRSDEAQKFFDQGMRLVWGFNHDEATRAFVKAGELDPGCASCWWGAAMTLGPNYNIPMLPDRARAAWDALKMAEQMAPGATPVEQALIAAMGKRYSGPEPLDPAGMQPLQEAYASAMGEVARRYPDDLDVQVLYAESRMNLNPWKLWSLDGKPAAGTEEIVAVLESALHRAPEHPGANHYYIHAVEASPEPGKALPSAERLAGLMRGAGHIVHMPAHIFQRVGRYAEAARSNRDGAAVDVAYLQRVAPLGYYGMYLTHNYDFQAFSAAMQGRSREAIEAQKRTIEGIPTSILDGIPGMDFFVSKSYFALLRFGHYEEVLKQNAPADKYAVWTGVHRFARVYAQAALGQLDEAAAGVADLDAYIARLPADLTAGYNSARDVLSIGSRLAAARIEQGRGRHDQAIALLTEATQMEDRLAYDEPSDWFFPVRHLLGAALLTHGKAAEAEAVYREDLRRNPDNGWALFGLAQALDAQKKDAGQARAAFARAWKDADVVLSASAF